MGIFTNRWMRKGSKERRRFQSTKEIFSSKKTSDNVFKVTLEHSSKLIDEKSGLTIICMMERVNLDEQMHNSVDWFSDWYEITTLLQYKDGTTIELNWEVAEYSKDAADIFLQDIEFNEDEMATIVSQHS